MKNSSQECRDPERGYVLLILLLFIALLSIGFAATVEEIGFEIRRNREEELIHRGVQYSRAVRLFIKTFRRYPNRIEELENTNNIRCLRKRYKDPITGQDFKILHLSDLPGFKPPGFGAVVTNGSSPQRVSTGVNFADGNAGLAGLSENGDEQISQSTDQNDRGLPNQNVPEMSPRPLAAPVGLNGTMRVFGGGPMVGVASISKARTIREFNKKDHYNEWQFVYDPSSDRGGLLTTPNQPSLQTAFGDLQNKQSVLPAPGTNWAQRNPALQPSLNSANQQ